jgi:hypothetical protein
VNNYFIKQINKVCLIDYAVITLCTEARNGKCLQRECRSSRDKSWNGDKPSANCRLFVNEECVTRFVIVPPRTCSEFYLEREVRLETDRARNLSGEKCTARPALFVCKFSYILLAGNVRILLFFELYALLVFICICLLFDRLCDLLVSWLHNSDVLCFL